MRVSLFENKETGLQFEVASRIKVQEGVEYFVLTIENGTESITIFPESIKALEELNLALTKFIINR